MECVGSVPCAHGARAPLHDRLRAREPQQRHDEELQVEFSFFDPRSEDYHAMRAMLSGGALLPEGIDPGGFADLLSEQAVVGTLVKGESIDTDLYGFISALSLQQHKETKCVQQLIASILKRLPDAPAREAVRAWMQDAQAPP